MCIGDAVAVGGSAVRQRVPGRDVHVVFRLEREAAAARVVPAGGKGAAGVVGTLRARGVRGCGAVNVSVSTGTRTETMTTP